MTTIDKKQCLWKALRASQILKRRSLADWPEMVDMVSTQMGMPITVEYVQNDKQEVIGINYLVPTDKSKLGESPLEKGIEYLTNHQAWLSDEDRSWGMNYHNQLSQGKSLTSREAQDIFSKLVKYQEKLEQGGINLPVSYSGLAHYYDSSKQSLQVFEGQLWGSPFGDPRELKSALAQKPQPLQVSKDLLMLGEMGVKIGHSFQNRNRELDGLDVLSTTASLTGASLIVLGLISEHLSKSDAKNYDPDNLLKDFAHQLQDLATQFDELDSHARPILQARDATADSVEEDSDTLQIILQDKQDSLDYPPIKFTGDKRKDLVILAKNIRLQQSLLIQALSPDRMPMPLTVSGTNESLKEAIAFLTKANHELQELVEEKLEQEQPIKTLEGAITAEALFNQARDFFCAKEKTEQRLFNPQLEYQLTANNLGLKIISNADVFQVFSDSYDLVCHIQRKEKDFVVLTEPSPELATVLTHLPTSETDIRQFIGQSNLLTLLQDIASDYCGKQLNFQTPVGNSYQAFCTFEFHPDRITAHNPQGDLIWENRPNEVVINQFSRDHLEKLVSFLSRPFSTVSTSSTPQKSHQTIEPNGVSFS